jgi:hypothetical protein
MRHGRLRWPPCERCGKSARQRLVVHVKGSERTEESMLCSACVIGYLARVRQNKVLDNKSAQ